MSMEHKAFDFDWTSFNQELSPVLIYALQSDNESLLLDFIKDNLSCITDPYEGQNLEDDWEEVLISSPIQDIADHTLTKYYSVTEDIGLGENWLFINETLPLKGINALLGISFREFDPGCCGSYFQSREQLNESIGILSQFYNPIVESYLDDLTNVRKGLYVTF